MNSPDKKLQALKKKILTDEEIAAVTEQMQEAMGPVMAMFAEKYGISVEDTFRFTPVATRIEEGRTKRGLTLKQAAAALKVPQYRLRYIETCSTKRLDPEIVLRYLEFLGLKSWFGRWKKANAEFAQRIGFIMK